MSDDATTPQADPDAPDPSGSFRFSRADFNLLRRAARQNWGVPDPLKTEALFQAARVITDPLAEDKVKLAAIRLLIAADRSDLMAEARKPEPETPAEETPRLTIPDADPRYEPPPE